MGCGMGYFSISMARIVGIEGKVVAADLQPKMLAGLQKRAEKHGLMERIELCQSTFTSIGVQESVNFALAFWMVHEVKQQNAFFQLIYAALNPNGKFLVVEPRIHVSEKNFDQCIELAQSVGFHLNEKPTIRFSRSALFIKQGDTND